MIRDVEKRVLDEQGYLVLPGLMSDELLETRRRRNEVIFVEDGSSADDEIKEETGARRQANLVNKGRVFEEVIVTPKVLDAMAHVLGPRFKLSSLNARSADGGGDGAQPLHADSGAIPDDGYWVCNSVWMLDDFTLKNG